MLCYWQLDWVLTLWGATGVKAVCNNVVEIDLSLPVQAILQDHFDVPSRTACSAFSMFWSCSDSLSLNVVLFCSKTVFVRNGTDMWTGSCNKMCFLWWFFIQQNVGQKKEMMKIQLLLLLMYFWEVKFERKEKKRKESLHSLLKEKSRTRIYHQY